MNEKFPFFTDIFVVYVRRRAVYRKFSAKNVIGTEIIRLNLIEKMSNDAKKRTSGILSVIARHPFSVRK
jgi:hypothetical protein